MGAGKQSIIEGGQKGKDNEAEVSDQALHVKVVSGGGGGASGDVNIAEVGGVAIGTTVPVSGTVSVTEPVSVDDNGGSLTVDGTVAVSSVGGTVTIQEPLSVDDNGSSLTVDGTVTVAAITAPVTLVEPVSVDDNGGSLTVDGTVAVSAVGGTVTVAGTVNVGTVAGTVTVAEPVSVDDNGGSLTIDTATVVGSVASATGQVFPAGVVRDDALTTLADPDGDLVYLRTTSIGSLWTSPVSSGGNALVITAAGAASVATGFAENSVVAAGHSVFPAGTVRDDVLATLGVADNDWTDLRVNSRGALWVIPDGTIVVSGSVSDIPVRSANTNLFNAQVFNNVTLNANSASFDCTLYRWLVVHITLTVASTPSNIRLIAQFSPDAGTTWTDYSVDQWVDLRYVPGQMPLQEIVPLNYVVGKLFRLRAVATGTTAAATFTLSAWVEGIN